MKLVIAALVAIATITGATVAATANRLEPESLESLEKEIHLQVDMKLRAVLSGLAAG